MQGRKQGSFREKDFKFPERFILTPQPPALVIDRDRELAVRLAPWGL
jgi:hypothetical protein